MVKVWDYDTKQLEREATIMGKTQQTVEKSHRIFDNYLPMQQLPPFYTSQNLWLQDGHFMGGKKSA